MILRNSHKMKFTRVDIRKFRLDIIPFCKRGFFIVPVLSGTICAFLIKYRLLRIEFNLSRFALLFGLFFFRIFKLVSSESTIITANSRTIFKIKSVIEFPKIVFKFFFKASLREWIIYLCFFAISFIHLPGSFKRRAIFFLEYMIRVYNKVIEVV